MLGVNLFAERKLFGGCKTAVVKYKNITINLKRVAHLEKLDAKTRLIFNDKRENWLSKFHIVLLICDNNQKLSCSEHYKLLPLPAQSVGKV
uniref:Uncharacterized protein n=1 Tax=Romanomermis culicivorax TaxID=13658 RepID=A0A915KW68_ROMCU